MHGAFADAVFGGGLPHGGAAFDDVIGQRQHPFPDMFLHRPISLPPSPPETAFFCGKYMGIRREKEPAAEEGRAVMAGNRIPFYVAEGFLPNM